MVRHLRGVGQDHDIGFQALGAVHGHHADRAAALLHVALDVGGALLEPVQETLERGRMRTLMRQRKRQEFVDGIGGLRAQPCGQAPAQALAERAGVKLEGRQKIRLTEHIRKEPMRAFEDGAFVSAGAQFFPQR